MENLPERWCLKSDRKEFVDYVNNLVGLPRNQIQLHYACLIIINKTFIIFFFKMYKRFLSLILKVLLKFV